MRSLLTNLTVLLAVTAAQTALGEGHGADQDVFSASLSDVAGTASAETQANGTYSASYADEDLSSGDSYSSSLTSFPSSYTDDSFRPRDIGLVGFQTGSGLASYKGGGKGGKGGCVTCGPTMFASFDFLQWYSRDRAIPPLVTTSPIGTPLADAGEIGNVAANTTILFGSEPIGGDRQAAGRLTLGLWADDSRDRALQLRVYANEGEQERFAAQSAGDPILARPFFDNNILVNAEAAFLVAYPGVFSGNIDITSKLDVIGGDLFLRKNFRNCDDYRIDLLAGYQFNRIDDDLVMFSSSQGAGVTTNMLDIFDVKNEYHAGEVGFIGELFRDCWTLSVLGKVALGTMEQRAFIDGRFTTMGAGNVIGLGGLMAQVTNMGRYQRDVAVWSPEAEIKLSYQVSQRLAMSVGYTAIWWSRVALAGGLVDRNLNGAQILNGGNPFAPPNSPQFVWNDTDYWVQAVSIGLDFNY